MRGEEGVIADWGDRLVARSWTAKKIKLYKTQMERSFGRFIWEVFCPSIVNNSKVNISALVGPVPSFYDVST